METNDLVQEVIQKAQDAVKVGRQVGWLEAANWLLRNGHELAADALMAEIERKESIKQ